MTRELGKSDEETAARGLLAIRGIGPNLVQRLTGTGLGTLEALAGATADDVLEHTAGWPSRPGRRRVGTWIDQARRLLDAGLPSAGERPSEALPARVRHTFTVEVQTNDTGSGAAVATKIVEVDSQAFDTWPGWDPERLAQFVAGRCGLDGPTSADGGGRAGAARPQPAVRAVRGYGILECRAPVAGGTNVRAVLRVGPTDTGADPEGRTVEWDLVCGPIESRADERLTSERVGLVPGDPVVSSVDAAVPERLRQARLVAVVRIVGTGVQPRLVRDLSDTTLDVVPS